MKDAARAALAEALRTVGIQLPLDDADAGRVMHELRKLGYRLRRMPRGQFEAYKRHLKDIPKVAE